MAPYVKNVRTQVNQENKEVRSMSTGNNTHTTFADGYREGYRAIMGNMVVLPVVPVAPVTPVGSTPYREGIKAGIAAASRR